MTYIPNAVCSLISVVVVGGDGTFTEAFDALVRRHAKECGLDLVRDPTVQLKQVPLRLGIVPAGKYFVDKVQIFFIMPLDL